MCWMCSNPTMTRTDYLERMADVVRDAGFAVQHVRGDRVRPPWCYTVGLTAVGLPELVVTGMSAARGGALLEDLAHHYVDHDAPMCEPGQRFTLRDGLALEIVELAHPDAHLDTAQAIFAPQPVRAYQLVWRDDRGRWPWEVGFRGRRGGQPVLGPRTDAPGPAPMS